MDAHHEQILRRLRGGRRVLGIVNRRNEAHRASCRHHLFQSPRSKTHAGQKPKKNQEHTVTISVERFAHLMKRNFKVIQSGLVYFIEWRMGPKAPAAALASSSAIADDAAGPRAASTSSAAAAFEATTESSGMSSREARKARRDRMKNAKEREPSRKQQKCTKDDDDDGMSAGAAPRSDEDLPAVHVAVNWEQYFSVRNLTGPHQGVPNVVGKLPPDEMVPNEPPSPPLPPAQPAKSSISSSPRPSTMIRLSSRLKASTTKNVTDDARPPSRTR